MFLAKLLPQEGMYCVAMLLPGGGFRHYFHSDIDSASANLELLDKAGNTVYIAQATFDLEKISAAQAHNKALPKGSPRDMRWGERTQANALFLKNFFLDIDIGEKWPLKTRKQAGAELRKFLVKTGLPMPSLVSSGHGLYAHWILEEAISAVQWKTTAYILKRVVAKFSPAIGGDASRTSDSASVLRAPGTTNRKPGKESQPVVIVLEEDTIPYLKFVDALNKAAKKGTVEHDALQAPKPTDLNAEFFIQYTSAPADAEKIAAHCAQVRVVRDTKGDVSEPLWYACIGILMHCEDGERIIHEWSSGHPDYSYAQTEQKMQQWRSAQAGPSTCAHLGGLSPTLCIGCPSNGKIKSPIVLGRPDPVAKVLPVEQLGAPVGFQRSEDGLYAREDDRWVKFYDQDLYISRLAWDESLGYEVMTIKHTLPFEGEIECTVRSSLVNDPKGLLTALSDNHIKVLGVKEKKYMVQYHESYQAYLQRMRRMTRLYTQMGWKEDNGKAIFVHGRKIYHTDGTEEDAGMAHNVPPAADAYRCEGSLEKWVEKTSVLGQPGMEPFAFAFCAGAFGSVLMKYTGLPGGLISMYGESGSGKTLISRWALSAWGFERELLLQHGDTYLSAMGRTRFNGSIMTAMDEVTDMEGLECSRMVYQITHGREKNKYTRNSVEKSNTDRWNLIMITTSNTSLVDKLSGVKQDARAEINRVLEYPVTHHPKFQDGVTEDIYWTIQENYGHAGAKFAKYLVQHHNEIKTELAKIRALIDSRSHLSGDERYWSAMLSVTIYGGLIAKRLGLVNFDMAPIARWSDQVVANIRGEKLEIAGNAVDFLGWWIDEHFGNMLIVAGDGSTRTPCQILERPRGALQGRLEHDVNRLFGSREVIKKDIARRFGSYSSMKDELLRDKILIDANRRKNLAAGTFYGGGIQPCWEINLNHPKLLATDGARRVTQTVDALAKAPLQKDPNADMRIG